MMEISAVWLISEEKDMVVLVEVDGQWYEIIRTFAPLEEMTISHCAHTKKELPAGSTLVDFGQPTEADIAHARQLAADQAWMAIWPGLDTTIQD